jgi:AcrR family transcriptional regulator
MNQAPAGAHAPARAPAPAPAHAPASERASVARRPGLRERKKARTRAAIRAHALRLFREQGYDATTVDQIADAADVSPSTFFRYFPTKEDVVLQDDFDVLAIDAFEAQPASLPPVAAFRAAAQQTFAALGEEELARLRETAELTLTVPELRARAMDEFARTIGVIAEAVARRSARDPDDFGVRILAGAIVGVIMAATMPWHDWATEEPGSDMLARIDAALCQLEAGLPL